MKSKRLRGMVETGSARGLARGGGLWTWLERQELPEGWWRGVGRGRAVFVGVVCGLLFAFVGLQARQTLTIGIEELGRLADVIVHAKVASLVCERDGGGRMRTRVELDVIGFWKGAGGGRTFTIYQAGGTLGRRRVTVEGQAVYRPGEEVVAFAVLNQRGEAVTIGLDQGKFDVTIRGETGDKIAHSPYHGLEGGGGRGSIAPASGRGGVLTLVELRRRVAGGDR